MSHFVLVPGAGGAAWYWHRVVPLLQAAGHTAVAIDLPADDESAGLSRYADLVAAETTPETILVGLSLGGFTIAMVAARVPVGGLIFVNAMIPAPHETPGEWGDAVGSSEARIAAAKAGGYSETFDDETYFFHDVSPELVAQSAQYDKPEAAIAFGDHCELASWPKVPIRAFVGADDRLFPVELQRRITRERLGIEIEVIPGGHLAPLSHPEALAEKLGQS
jgi:pimeloyl-ACP methyl ester carboxylesterase